MDKLIAHAAARAAEAWSYGDHDTAAYWQATVERLTARADFQGTQQEWLDTLRGHGHG